MANVAAVFHWTPETMNPMPLEELARWHALAVERAGISKGA
jgi:hypothetical protein